MCRNVAGHGGGIMTKLLNRIDLLLVYVIETELKSTGTLSSLTNFWLGEILIKTSMYGN